jgi:hypothetical protein
VIVLQQQEELAQLDKGWQEVLDFKYLLSLEVVVVVVLVQMDLLVATG